MHDRYQNPVQFQGAMHPAMWINPSRPARRASPKPLARPGFLAALATACFIFILA